MYIEIQAENETQARLVMHGLFGNQWAFIYPEKDAPLSCCKTESQVAAFCKRGKLGTIIKGQRELNA